MSSTGSQHAYFEAQVHVGLVLLLKSNALNPAVDGLREMLKTALYSSFRNTSCSAFLDAISKSIIMERGDSSVLSTRSSLISVIYVVCCLFGSRA